MSGHDPLDTVRTGVGALRRGTTLAPPAPPARTPPSPPAADQDETPQPSGGDAESATERTGPQDAGDGVELEADRDTPGAATRPRRSDTTRRRRRGSDAKSQSGAADVHQGDDGLPGFARGARRQIGVGLTEATFEQLRAARTNQFSNGDIVLEALRRTHSELVAEYAPAGDDSDDLFPSEPRRKRRLGIEGVRRMEFMCSPAEAAVIGELAKRCDLSLSALIEAALTRHLIGAQRPSSGEGPAGQTGRAGQDHPDPDAVDGANDPTR